MRRGVLGVATSGVQDASLAAHFEFTIAITADDPRILTPWHLENGE